MPKYKASKGNIQVQKLYKANCLLQHTGTYQVQLSVSRGQDLALTAPSETNYSYGPPAAGACPMDDGTLGSQGCPTNLCMLTHLHSP